MNIIKISLIGMKNNINEKVSVSYLSQLQSHSSVHFLFASHLAAHPFLHSHLTISLMPLRQMGIVDIHTGTQFLSIVHHDLLG